MLSVPYCNQMSHLNTEASICYCRVYWMGQLYRANVIKRSLANPTSVYLSSVNRHFPGSVVSVVLICRPYEGSVAGANSINRHYTESIVGAIVFALSIVQDIRRNRSYVETTRRTYSPEKPAVPAIIINQCKSNQSSRQV